MVFQTVIKNNVMMNTKNTKTKHHELLNNLLYNIFAVNLITHKKLEMTIQILTPQITIVTNIIKITITIDTEIMIDIVAIVENNRKTIIDQILDKDITIDLEVHIDLDLIIIINEELHLDLHIDLHIEKTQITDITPAQDIDLVLNHKETPLNDIIIHIDLHQDLEILDHDLEHPHDTDNNRINQVDVKSTKDNDSTKFEIQTCQITELANIITPYSWFYPLYVHASETNDNILPSKLEILFLLDTGASISVLNLPTFHVISKQLNINVPTNLQNKRAKTLTVANQTEVPIIHYISMTCFTEVNHQTRSFNIDFAVANIKYNILGTPFFKKHIQIIDFQQNIMTYIEQHPKLSTKTTFSTFTEKDYLYISYIYTIKCKEPIHFKPRSGKPYISQLKTFQIYILNLKIIQNFIQQIHIHISYKNLEISFISWI